MTYLAILLKLAKFSITERMAGLYLVDGKAAREWPVVALLMLGLEMEGC